MINKYSKSILWLFSIVFILTIVSCDPARKYEKAEKESISNYLNSNSSLNFTLKPSGLYYLEVVTGTGLTPVKNDTVYVRYTGKFLDGNLYGTNVGGTIDVFPLGQYWRLDGYEEGISYLKEGGKATLLLPSNLAYGTQGNGYNVAGYTPLLFDVELIKVAPGVAK